MRTSAQCTLIHVKPERLSHVPLQILQVEGTSPPHSSFLCSPQLPSTSATKTVSPKSSPRTLLADVGAGWTLLCEDLHQTFSLTLPALKGLPSGSPIRGSPVPLTLRHVELMDGVGLPEITENKSTKQLSLLIFFIGSEREEG